MSADTKTQMFVQTRRDALKTSAIAAAAGAAGLAAPVDATAQTGADGIRWDKGVCRFCGTGCGVIVGTKKALVLSVKKTRSRRRFSALVERIRSALA